MLVSPGPRHSFFYVTMFILISVLLCIPTFCWLFFPEISLLSKPHPIPIKNLFIVSSNPTKISGIIISELLGLSADVPTFLHEFSTKQAEATLHNLGIFSSVTVKKFPDNKGLIISYTLNTPIAYVANQSNTLFNLEGNRFPCQPFFQMLTLPRVFFPIEDLLVPLLPAAKISLVASLLQELARDSLAIIDLSTADDYPGEIIVTLASGSLLRLPRHALKPALDFYKDTKKSLPIDTQEQYIYDLRFSNFLLLKKL
ncbi:hypothetical protein Cs308_0537 [Candidatus Chlamydia sanziniae]|uniref:Cell division protein FtsQ n=2 Tax=Candidatus Chlamydia sanziniae TaxID=1806891 RepID=A0A1A9HVI5_9CHLA|nr:hypothetical protein Cs308_0537 [Candidatus Chlamydia sanziniae]